MYEKLNSRNAALGYRISSPLNKEEIRQIAEELEAAISRHQKISVLLDLQAFPYAELAALWEDLKFDVKHARNIDRLALVGGGNLEQTATKLFGLLTSTQCRCFAEKRITDAWDWLLDGFRGKQDPSEIQEPLMNNNTAKARAVGINHVALEVDDIEEGLAFYRSIIQFKLRGKSEKMAFLDFGDQFLALSEGRTQAPDGHRHFGLVVDDKEAVRAKVKKLGCIILPSPFPEGLDFLDPWGNRLQIVEYRSIQFSKTDAVLKGMGLNGLSKSEDAKEELQKKGLL